MTQSGGDKPGTYRVTFHRDAEKGLDRLSRANRDKVFRFADTVLSRDARPRITKQTEKLSVLGDYYQWRIDRSNCPIWFVRDEAREVRVVYVGPHPTGRDYSRIAGRTR